MAKKRKVGRPRGSNELRSLLSPGVGGRCRAEATPWKWRCCEDKGCTLEELEYDTDSDSQDEDYLPELVEDSESSDESEDDVELTESEDEEEEVVNLQNLRYPSNKPAEGFRLIDIAELDNWLQNNVCCKTCAEQRTTELLSEFVKFCTEVLNVHGLLGAIPKFWRSVNPKKSTSTKKSGHVPTVRIATETVDGWQSHFGLECTRSVPHRMETELSSCSDLIDDDGSKRPEANVRMADAFLNIGRGAHDWLWFAAKLNAPLAVSNHMHCFRAAERYLGAEAEKLTKKACKQVIQKMKELSVEQGSCPAIYEGAEIWPVCVGIDCGWPQRASGNVYKSNGGVTTATYQPQGTARTPRAKELMQERAVVNRLVARVAFLEGEPFDIVASRPSQRRCADVMATPRANAQPKLLRASDDSSVCRHCGLRGHNRRSSKQCKKHIPRSGSDKSAAGGKSA